MDELFGYLPPTANPPSKGPLLTLLKQARAYGVGLVLSTQNPVDLDYKALSNAGTWFIGRLQTERDKERVLAGLEGAAAGGKFDRRRTEQILAGLGQRLFYLHSVHGNEPVIFSTRWTLSYLAGPLTRNQISSLPSNQVIHKTGSDSGSDYLTPKISIDHEIDKQNKGYHLTPPVLAPEIQQVYLPANSRDNKNMVYVPSVIGVADVLYNNTKYGVAVSKGYTLLAPLHEGPMALDWNEARQIELDTRALATKPMEGLSYATFPNAAANARSYEKWRKLLAQFIRTTISIKLLSNPMLKIVSEPGEDERDFRIRLQHLAHELRDQALEALKKKYETKIDALEDRQRRARQAYEKQNAMASQKKMEAAVSAGAAILGAIFGRSSVSATSISKVGTAVKSTSRALKSGQGINQAQETLESVDAQLEELQLELEQELEKISESYNMLEERLEEVEIRATSGNITVHLVGLAWVPFIRGDKGEVIQA